MGQNQGTLGYSWLKTPIRGGQVMFLQRSSLCDDEHQKHLFALVVRLSTLARMHWSLEGSGRAAITPVVFCGSGDRLLTKPRGMNQKSCRVEPRTQRRARRPAKRWEDNLNELVKDEEIEATQSNDLKNNNTWFTAPKNVYEWAKKERKTIR